MADPDPQLEQSVNYGRVRGRVGLATRLVGEPGLTIAAEPREAVRANAGYWSSAGGRSGS